MSREGWTDDEILQMRRAKLSRQRECDHSFNDRNECEYCGISDGDYGSSCSSGDEIGSYR